MMLVFVSRSWINNMLSVITADELPDDVTNAEILLARHQEHKAEIDARQRSVVEFYEGAEKLIEDGHCASADVKEKKQRLHSAWQALENTWSERGLQLEHSKEVHVFKRDADQLEAWLNARDLDQESIDVGDSLEAVEELLKKHDEFEKMLQAQEVKLQGLKKLTQQEAGPHKRKETYSQRFWEEGGNDIESEKEEDRHEHGEREISEQVRLKEKEERRDREVKERERLEEIRSKEKERERQEQERRENKRLEEIRLKKETEEKQKQKRKVNESPEEKIRLKQEKERKETENIQRTMREKQRSLEMMKREDVRLKRRSSDEKGPVDEEEVRTLPEDQRKIPTEKREQSTKNSEKNHDVYYANQNRANATPLVSSPFEGILQRKQELESGGKKAHARAWKTLYTVLRGHQLLFYREKKSVQSRNYSAPPVDLRDGLCEEASDYAKRRNAFRLVCSDDSDFLFVAKDPSDQQRWISIISSATGQQDLSIPPPPPPPTARLPRPPLQQTEERETSGSLKVTRPHDSSSKPLITVTSFDDDDEASVPPPVNTPAPVIPFSLSTDASSKSDEESETNTSDFESFSLEPDDLPPPIPPDFSNLDSDSVDSDAVDELPVLPTSPPPEFLSDEESVFHTDFGSSPPYIPTQLDHPIPPPRSKTKPSPLPGTHTLDGCFQGKGPQRTSTKPPIKPKPILDKANPLVQPSADFTQVTASPGTLRSTVHDDDKRHDKKKGVFGNIFKKKR